MSDSVTKWHEMQEDKQLREKVELTEQERKDAYKILAYYSENSIKHAYEILSINE